VSDPFDSGGPSEGLINRASWLLTGRIIGDLGLFVYYLLLARRFGASGIGDYSFAFAFASFFTLGVDFGLRNLLTRRIARSHKEASRIAVTVLGTQLGFSVGLLVVLCAVAILVGYSSILVGYLVLAFLALALQIIGTSFAAFLEAVGDMRRSALAALAHKSVIVVVGIAMVLGGAGLALVMTAQVAAGLLYVAVGLRWTWRRFGPFDLAFRPALAGALLKMALPFLATAALWEIYSRVDIVMLHLFRGDAETGLYAAAYKIISAPHFVAQLIGVAVFPTLARAVNEDRPELERVFRETLRALSVLGLLGGLLLFVAGDGLVVTLFGSEFAPSGRIVRLMAPLFVIQFLMVPLWRLLLAMDRERTLVMLRLGSVGLNVALNFLLIPRYGPMGAVATSLISEGLTAVAQFALCLRIVPRPYMGRGIALLTVFGAATAIGMLARPLLPWGGAAAVAGVTFTALVFAARLVHPTEVGQLLRDARLSGSGRPGREQG